MEHPYHNPYPRRIDRQYSSYVCSCSQENFLRTDRFTDAPPLQSNFARPGPPSGASMGQQGAGGGRWDAILADRQSSTQSSGNGNTYQRGSSGNYNNRNVRDNNSGGYGGQRDNHYNRRDNDSQKPFHSHVGGQSGDTAGADWNTSLPPNPNLEK